MIDAGQSAVPPAEARPARVVLVDDSVLFRSGVATLLGLAGVEVVGELGSTEALAAVVERDGPDVVIMDVRLPPSHTDEGIRAAIGLRARYPRTGVLVLSTYAEGAWVRQLFGTGSAGLGYLLKDRVDDVPMLVEAIERVRTGGTVVDPEVISRLLAPTAGRSDLDRLSERERAVLALMAEGRSNVGIGQALFLSARTVEAHIAAVFTKLALDMDDHALNRRVLAVLTFLQNRNRYE